MSSAADQFADFAQRGQRAVVDAIKGWADAAGELVLTFTELRVPAEAHQAVDDAYDLAERMLHSQRELATGLLAAGADVLEAVGRAAEQATRGSTEAVHRMADEAAARGAWLSWPLGGAAPRPAR